MVDGSQIMRTLMRESLNRDVSEMERVFRRKKRGMSFEG